jgi:hypothetical protein
MTTGLRKLMLMFWAHKQCAKRRDIKFKFTFEEWVTWWKYNLGPEWAQKRGRRPDQYCMARIGDIGPYAVWNVKCITNEENRREAGFVKLTKEQAIDIFNSKENFSEIASQYQISKGTVNDIKFGRTWRHVTKIPPPPKFIHWWHSK